MKLKVLSEDFNVCITCTFAVANAAEGKMWTTRFEDLVTHPQLV